MTYSIQFIKMGAFRFHNLLWSSPDLLSDVPLEAAYNWSLSCMSAMQGKLLFSSRLFYIECKKLLPGRLFPTDDSSSYDETFAEVKHNVVYFARERDGRPTHPLADIFFCTKEGEIVLVDVTGGNNDVVERKVDRLARWIEQEQPKVTGLSLHGVVLAPLATCGSMERDSVVSVCGKEAQDLLGGLQQVFRWF